MDGKTGKIKWKHEPGDFELVQSDMVRSYMMDGEGKVEKDDNVKDGKDNRESEVDNEEKKRIKKETNDN